MKQPADLKGKRIGIPEWAQTASVYSRGLLRISTASTSQSIQWVQAGVDQPGRLEKVKLNLPAGIKYSSAVDKSFSGMLVSGEIDAALSAHPPACFEQGHPNVARLFPDYLEIEHEIRQGHRHLSDHARDRDQAGDRREHPWIAANLFDAFEEAKRRSIERALQQHVSALPMPWGYEFARRMQEIVGEDLLPYGIDANRTTLDAFLQYGFEQGVLHKRMQPEDLFPPQVQRSFKV